MKVIFLDIDGVLNHKEHMISEYNKNHSTSSYHMELDQNKIKMLADFVHETNSVVVISSSWRIGGFEKSLSIQNLMKQLNNYGIIIGGYTSLTFERVRGREIAQWIVHNCISIPNFCIFDDHSNMEDLEDHLVKTSWDRGLEDIHIQMAKQVLDKTPSTKVVNYIKREGVK